MEDSGLVKLLFLHVSHGIYLWNAIFWEELKAEERAVILHTQMHAQWRACLYLNIATFIFFIILLCIKCIDPNALCYKVNYQHLATPAVTVESDYD